MSNRPNSELSVPRIRPLKLNFEFPETHQKTELRTLLNPTLYSTADFYVFLDPDERTNDIEEERRAAEHDSEFYDVDRDQDGDTMPLPPIVRTNGGNGNGNGRPEVDPNSKQTADNAAGTCK